MSINSQEKKCAVCSAYLFEEDDVVYCPTCGAPHHRDCYKSVGHCGLEELHGTENQYNLKVNDSKEAKEEEQEPLDFCSRCKKPLSNDASFCPYCGAPRSTTTASFGRYQGFLHIDAEGEIEEGVTAREVLPIIAVNQGRYVPRFLKSDKKSSFSWNWAGFLFPHVWFGFRKMYQACWVFSIAMIISTLLSLPFNLAVTKLPGYIDLEGGSAALGGFILENAHLIDRSVLILAAIGSLLHFGIMIAGGLFGDKIYKKHIVRVAKDIRQSDDKEAALRKKGGINLFVPLLVMAAASYLPSIIFTFASGIFA